MQQRLDEADAALPRVDYERYVWQYARASDGRWAPVNPAAPPWSRSAWRDELLAVGYPEDEADALMTSLEVTAHAVYLAKSPADRAELERLESEREAQLAPYDLNDDLEALKVREWQAYGDQLRDRVLAATAAMPGLNVPIEVTVDTSTFRGPDARLHHNDPLTERLIEAAIMDTPSPADMPGTPLDRLAATREQPDSE